MITGNKGEWSEVYALLKIISDKQLYPGDSNLNKIQSLILPIIKVLRDEINGTFAFSYENDLVLIKNDLEVFRIPITKFKEKANLLLLRLKEKTDSTFSVQEIESFINSYGSQSIKAKSTVKSDIRIVIHDQRTGSSPELGFSIKSQLGGSSTLLNAGKTTNFIYEIENVNLTEEEIKNVNLIDTRSKIKDRINKIYELGGNLKYIKSESSIFGNNLILIDSALPQIISETLKLFFTSNYSKCIDLINQISEINPLNFDAKNNHPFYIYKFKRFITDIALGMMPSKVWTGQLDATGGYLIVKENGDVLCYHIYNRNEFEEYLFSNTKFETSSSSRHEYGSIYMENNKLFFKLNLQIRFL
jgi:HpaII restriction endonuclease